MSCPPPAEVERVFWTARHTAALVTSDAKLRAHVMACNSCRSAWDEIAKLAALGAEIAPSAQWERREEIRTTLLANTDLPAGDRPLAVWRRWWVTPLACAAALLAWWFVIPAEPGTPPVAKHRAHVLAHPGARSLLVAEPPDEIVRLVDGTLTVTVPALAATERFRVIVGDDEVSASSAAFDVTARGDALVAVRVMHGQVRIVATGVTQTAQAGATWRATQLATNESAATVEASQPAVVESSAPVVVEPPGNRTVIEPAQISPRPADPIERPRLPTPEVVPEVVPGIAPPQRNLAPQALDDGWAALRAGAYASAAKAFERALVVTSDPQIVEDATFWRGVALARSGEVALAARVLDGFVRGFPHGARVGEAHVILGWLLFERGDRADARTHFDAAANDRSSRVRARARAGLTALTPKP